jgi:hypothetical protein
MVAVLCLPMIAAVLFSGALSGGTAYAAMADGANPARHETETGTPGTPGGTGTAEATHTEGTHTPGSTGTPQGTGTPEGTHTPGSTGTPEGTHTPGVTGTPEGTHTPGSTGTPQVTGTPQTFSDVNPTDYFYAPVLDLYSRGAIAGYPDGTFRPYNNITRGQIAKVVVLALQWPQANPATGTFSDVAPGSTFFPYVETAVQHGVISGYPDGTYRPNNDLTRGQIAKIMVMAQQWALANPATATFSDVPVGSTFFQYVETAVTHTLLSGYPDGTFRPNTTATRGQASKIIYNGITGAR